MALFGVTNVGVEELHGCSGILPGPCKQGGRVFKVDADAGVVDDVAYVGAGGLGWQ